MKALKATGVSTIVLKNVENFTARGCTPLPDTQVSKANRREDVRWGRRFRLPTAIDRSLTAPAVAAASTMVLYVRTGCAARKCGTRLNQGDGMSKAFLVFCAALALSLAAPLETRAAQPMIIWLWVCFLSSQLSRPSWLPFQQPSY